MNYDEKFQLLIIGESTVGKTSLLFRYAEDKYSSQYLATVGIDFFTKDEIINGKTIRVKIWDTAGQERYKSLTTSFYRNAHGIILVYDVSNPESFEKLKYWIQSISMYLGEKSSVKMILIGNKIDTNREVRREDGENFAKQHNIPYFETSAKQGIGIQEFMHHMIGELIKENTPEKRDTLRISNRNSNNEGNDKKCKC